VDYSGVMGVPITFLNKYNPDQFIIVGLATGRDDYECHPIKKYVKPIQYNMDGSQGNGSKVNTGPVLSFDTAPTKGVYYTAENSDKYLKTLYARILIKANA
ncbi:UNVERIFIED_CONTAM: adenine-specific methyltransferase EcoRI family protein, partial [Kocuria sp. CPCC 205274]